MTKKISDYEQGFRDGLLAFAIMRDGVYYVGNERPLKKVLEEIHTTWNFNEPAKCAHVFGKRKNTPYTGVYQETCVKCGHVEEFEKDYS